MGKFIEWWIAALTSSSIPVLGIEVPAWLALLLGLGIILSVVPAILRPR